MRKYVHTHTHTHMQSRLEPYRLFCMRRDGSGFEMLHKNTARTALRCSASNRGAIVMQENGGKEPGCVKFTALVPDLRGELYASLPDTLIPKHWMLKPPRRRCVCVHMCLPMSVCSEAHGPPRSCCIQALLVCCMRACLNTCVEADQSVHVYTPDVCTCLLVTRACTAGRRRDQNIYAHALANMDLVIDTHALVGMYRGSLMHRSRGLDT